MKKTASLLLAMVVLTSCILSYSITATPVSGEMHKSPVNEIFIQDPAQNKTYKSEDAFKGLNGINMTKTVTGTEGAVSGAFIMLWGTDSINFWVEINDPTHTPNTDMLEVVLDLNGDSTGDFNMGNLGTFVGNCDNWMNGASQGGSMVQKGQIWATTYSETNQKYYFAIQIQLNAAQAQYLAVGNKIKMDIRYFDPANSGETDRMKATNIIAWSTETATGLSPSASAGIRGGVSELGLVTLVDSVAPYTIKQGKSILATPDIDGAIDEIWLDEKVPVYDINNNLAVFGMGKTNVSGKFRTLWDARGIYFLIEVTDPTPNTGVSMAEFYKNDGIDIFLDLSNNHGSESKSINDDPNAAFFSITGDGEYSNAQNGMANTPTNLIGKRTATGYLYECFIQWTIPAEMVVGKVIGVDIQINDNTTGAAERSGICTWSDNDGMDFAVVNKYGDITLADEGLFVDKTIRPITPTDTDLKVNYPAADKIGSSNVSFSWQPSDICETYIVQCFKVSGSGSNKTYTYMRTEEAGFDPLVDIYGLDNNELYAFQVVGCDAFGAKTVYYSMIEVQLGGSQNTSENSSNTSADPENANTGDMIILYVFLLITLASSLLILAKRKKA